MAAAMKEGVVRTLWTGGWDSTFRICQLVLHNKVPVEPYYVIEPERRSATNEITAMSRIRRGLERVDSSAAGLLAPTTFVCKHDLDDDPDLTRRFENLRKRALLGPQYLWLAALAQQRGLEGLELSVHVDDRAYPFIKECAEEFHTTGGLSYRIPPSMASEDISLFGHFTFPLLEWSKVDMEAFAREHGFLNILGETWFCFVPLRGKPCGLCDPCNFAMIEGMQHRLTTAGRIRHRFRPVLFTGPRGVVRILRKIRGRNRSVSTVPDTATGQ